LNLLLFSGILLSFYLLNYFYIYLRFTEGDLNVVNKYNNKMKHFFEYRERINEIAVNTQIQFLIGQPGQIFKKVGKDIAKSMKLFNTMQKDCKKLFER